MNGSVQFSCEMSVLILRLQGGEDAAAAKLD